MQRHRCTSSLKEGSSVSVSARALIILLPIDGSAAQCGINPHCMSPALVDALMTDYDGNRRRNLLGGNMLKRCMGNVSSPPPCFTLLLPEVPRCHRASISLDAANFLPAIDDDEVKVYVLASDKINGYGAGAVWVYDISGTLINQRHDQPVKTLGSFSVAVPLAVTDDASDSGVRPDPRNSAGKSGTKRALNVFECTVVRAGISLLPKKYTPDPQQDEKTKHEAGFG